MCGSQRVSILRSMLIRTLFISILSFSLFVPTDSDCETAPREYISRAIDHWRGTSSRLNARMTVSRPDWERTMELISWTSGRDRSLVRFTAPAKDAGNASLILENSLWTYSSKINRVIPIPESMRTQSWMGSDFSYQDLAREDDILDDYEHRLLEEQTVDGKKVRIIEAVPYPEAAVVWGKEIVWVREDNIFLKHQFYDQNGQLIKELSADTIGKLDEKLLPIVLTMRRKDKSGHATKIEYLEGEFDTDFPPHLFTLSNLRNPRME